MSESSPYHAMPAPGFQVNEASTSQVPALQLLMNLGFEYLPPAEAMAERSGKTSNVLLERILREQLAHINRIRYQGEEYLFSEANIQEAVQKLRSVEKNIRHDGTQKTNETIYDLITLGTALEQTVAGASKSFTLRYIDWEYPENNVFHVAAEYSVERTNSEETARPDIVLFVNGLPLGVIECKSPNTEVEQAVSQNIRNQGSEYIPHLFAYVQLIMAANKNEVKYATAGTETKFWSVWKELEDSEEEVARLVNAPLSDNQKDKLFSGDFTGLRARFDGMERGEARLITEQDRAIHSLCRPQRLLELTYRFILFENGAKKIARYHQFFTVRSAMARVANRNANGSNEGGFVWHTQGSGKSLTMVMLARALAIAPGLSNPRIILVTDREDLDRQLGNTFQACGLDKQRATSGRHLVKLLDEKAGIVTTLIHKFDTALNSGGFIDESSDIFVLVDESHRTNYGTMAAKMRGMLPNACYFGFTGTPLTKEEKNTFQRFGELIEPSYSIRQAVEDGAVVPLLYEGRLVKMKQNKADIDLWFERHTADLSREQKADLKRKYARAGALNRADRVVYMRAFDVSEHYRKYWKGTGFKAQLVAPDRATAIKYHEALKEIDGVASAVVISAPDTREGREEVDEDPKDEVIKFWDKMMKRYGANGSYPQHIIDQFKKGDEPEILIVVDMLLTGFDAPRNTVLYLCRPLREHTLLQAIARVNRPHEGKDFGYVIDYQGVLGELNEALTMYDELAGFDEEDLADALISIDEEVRKLPQRYSDLWDLFREIGNKQDEEAFERLLADDELRGDFYEHLSRYAKTLGIALSSEKFIMETDEAQLKRYKRDLERFMKLRKAVKLRYAEAINYQDYDPKIQKLLDTHIQANEVLQLNKPVDILNEREFKAIQEGRGEYQVASTAARADAIAHAAKRTIHEKMEEDPALYEKFSKLIQQAIDDFKAQRISEQEYLKQAGDIRDDVAARRHDDAPDAIRDDDEACAYYGVNRRLFSEYGIAVSDDALCELSRAIQDAFDQEQKVDFWTDERAIRHSKGRINDFFFEALRDQHGINLADEQMDEIIEKAMKIRRSRRLSQ